MPMLTPNWTIQFNEPRSDGWDTSLIYMGAAVETIPNENPDKNLEF